MQNKKKILRINTKQCKKTQPNKTTKKTRNITKKTGKQTKTKSKNNKIENTNSKHT